MQKQADAAARAHAKDEREQHIRELQALFDGLESAHRERFESAALPVVPPPEFVTAEQYYDHLERLHLADIRWYDRARRRNARHVARQQSEEDARRYNAYLVEQQEAATAEAMRSWAALCSNEPEAVMNRVNDAYADNQSYAVAVDIAGGMLSVLMVQPPFDLIPDQRPATTPGGRPTLKRMTKTERGTLWTRCTASRAVATMVEAFSVLPRIEEVRLAVVSQASDEREGHRLVIVGDVPRSRFENVDWCSQDADALLALSGVTYKLDRFGILTPLPVEDDPSLLSMVNAINQAVDVDSEPPDLNRSASSREII